MRVAASRQLSDAVNQFERAVLAAREVLYQTHDEAVLFARFNDHRRDFRRAKSNEGFEPPLSADQIIAVLSGSLADRDRFLEAKRCNGIDQLLKHPLVAHTRIEHGDEIDRYLPDFGGCVAHAALLSEVRRVRSMKASRLS